MLPLLALLAQTATLEADTATAAMRCARAVSAAGGESAPHLTVTAQASYFGLQATQADLRGQPFIQRLREVTDAFGASASLPRDEARALLPQCDQRFPRARWQGSVTLPADPLKRDLMCMGALAIINGAAQSAKQQDAIARFEKMLVGVRSRLTDAALAAQGIRDAPSYERALGDQLAATLALGNIAVIADACEKQLPRS